MLSPRMWPWMRYLLPGTTLNRCASLLHPAIASASAALLMERLPLS